MGNEYKTFLVPSFCMVGNGSFVPGPFLVGFGGMKVGMSIGDLTLSSKLTAPSSYIHALNLIAGFHVKLAPRILVWIPLPNVQTWSRHSAKMLLPCMSRRVAPTLSATGPKEDASFCKKPCLAGSQKQAFLASWLWALPVCVCLQS